MIIFITEMLVLSSTGRDYLSEQVFIAITSTFRQKDKMHKKENNTSHKKDKETKML